MKQKLKAAFHGFDTVVRWMENVGVGITFGSIVVLLTATVTLRYLFKSGIMWGAEVQEVLVVALAMFGCAKATREGGHTELTMITGMLPRTGRILLRTLTTVAALSFLGLFFVTSLQYTLSTGNLKTIMLKIPYRYFYMFMPIGMGLNLYEFLKRVPARILNDPPPEY